MIKKRTESLKKGDIIQYQLDDWRTVCSDAETDGDVSMFQVTGADVVAHKDAMWLCRRLVAVIRVYSDGYVEKTA